jgi:hypothetical protein
MCKASGKHVAWHGATAYIRNYFIAQAVGSEGLTVISKPRSVVLRYSISKV